MEQRLQQFLSAENISQSQFADKLGVARASVSHILSGRNKPGFDFIESMSRTYPSLNLEWLIMGKGKMYKEAIVPTTLFEPVQQPSEIEEPQQHILFEEDARVSPVQTQQTYPQTQQTIPQPQSVQPAGRRIEKIIAFYSDGTFQELK